MTAPLPIRVGDRVQVDPSHPALPGQSGTVTHIEQSLRVTVSLDQGGFALIPSGFLHRKSGANASLNTGR